MGTIYVASYAVPIDPTGTYQHSYLVYDTDGNAAVTDDQFIIRGGPDDDLGFEDILQTQGLGAIIVESNRESALSKDGLDNIGDDNSDGYLFNDKDKDGTADSIVERGYTQLSTSDSLWNSMVTFANSLVGNSFDYKLLDTNSNSVINSVLNAVGIDFRTIDLPGTGVPALYPGHTSILDGTGSDNFTAFSHNNDIYFFHDSTGSDTITVEKGARLAIINDAISTSGNTVILEDVDLRDLTISNDAAIDDMVVRTQTSDLVTVDDQLGSGGRGIDVLELRSESGTLIHSVDLSANIQQADYAAGLDFSKTFTTFDAVSNVKGNDTDDKIFGNSVANTLTGGRGNDTLNGGAGTDTYYWALGDGNDTIIDNWTDSDQLILSGGISSDMVTVGTSGSDLTLTIATASGTGGTITINGQASAASTFLASHVQGITHTEADPTTTTYLWGTFNQQTQQYEDIADTVTGSAANDHIDGKNDNDTLSGGAGDDFIEGGAGSDVLNGDAGDDRLEDTDGGTLNGGADNDTLIAWGNAVLNGGSGDDIIIANGTSATIDGGDDDDIISVTTSGATADIDGGSGNDVYHLAANTTTTIQAGTGDDVVYLAGVTATTTIEFLSSQTLQDLTITLEPNARDLLITHSAGSVLLADYTFDPAAWNFKFGSTGTPVAINTIGTDYSYTGTETVTFSGGEAINVANITTGSGSDVIETSDTDSTVTAGAGQDDVTGGDGNDTVYGGDDIDTIDGGAGDDILYGDGGDDVIVGGTGANTIYGGAGNDTITNAGTGAVYGGDGNDAIDGSGDLNGGAGNDTIDALASTGSGTIHGDDGDDIINAGASTGSKTINGDGGNDTIYVQMGQNTVDGGTGNDTITLGGVLSVNSNTVDGGAGDDTIHAVGDTNTINGGADNDTISVFGTGNVIDGGSGDNTIDIQDGDNKIIFSAGMHAASLSGINASAIVDFGAAHSFSTLTFSYVDSNNDIEVTDGTSTVRMGSFILDQTVWQAAFGGASQAFTITDTVTSYAGSTEALNITAMTGVNDDVTVGDGDDVVATYDGVDIIHAGAGNDDVNGGVGNDTIYGDDGDDILNGDAGADLIYGGNGVDNISGGLDNDQIHAGAGADFVLGDDGDDTIYGDDGDDTIYGGLGADYIRGGTENDSLFGEDGDDLIYGDTNAAYGAGNDYIDGGAGDDRLYGWYGDDILIGGDGVDRLYGDWGNDQIDAGSGNDYAYGGDGDDLIGGFDGTDYIRGNNGNDIISGGNDKDTIYGDDGNDTIYGDDGHDSIYGGSGDDIIIGGAGNDNMWGNAGADTFVLEPQPYADKIRDFNLSENDLIDISALLIDYDPLQDDLNDFVTLTNNYSNQHTLVYVDRDGTDTAHSSTHAVSLISRPNITFSDIENNLITE